QFRNVVVGTELSATWGNSDGTSSGTGLDGRGCFRANAVRALQATETVSRSCNVDQDWSVQWLTKLGVAYGQFLVYATGGVAVTKLDMDRHIHFERTVANQNGGAGIADFRWSGDSTHVGVVFGGGLQYAITENLSLGVEYLRTEYASADMHTTG